MPERKGVRNLVIGANSFLAQALIVLLNIEKEYVAGVFNNRKDHLAAPAEYIPLAAMESLQDDFDRVFLIGAFIPGKEDTKPALLAKSLFDANVDLVNRVCGQFKSARVIYSSSVSVYNTGPEIKNEASCCNPGTEYGISKLWGEKIVSGHASNAIVRISSMYGPGMKESTLIPFFVNKALREKNITVSGDGSRSQNYIHVSDVARCLQLAAGWQKNNVFLATATHSVTNREVAEMISGISGCAITYTGADASASSFYDNSLTREYLQFQPSVSLPDGLKELIEWKNGTF